MLSVKVKNKLNLRFVIPGVKNKGVMNRCSNFTLLQVLELLSMEVPQLCFVTSYLYWAFVDYVVCGSIIYLRWQCLVLKNTPKQLVNYQLTD